MKFTTIGLASVLAFSSTFAFAQAGGSAAGAEVPEKSGPIVKGSSGGHSARTTGNSMSSGGTSSSATTTGSGAPQDKPNLSGSSETSDTSRKVK
jgi:hypothetical protein